MDPRVSHFRGGAFAHERGLRAGVVVPRCRAPPVAAKEQWDDPECRCDIMLCSDLPAEGDGADPVRVPSQSGMGP